MVSIRPQLYQSVSYSRSKFHFPNDSKPLNILLPNLDNMVYKLSVSHPHSSPSLLKYTHDDTLDNLRQEAHGS